MKYDVIGPRAGVCQDIENIKMAMKAVTVSRTDMDQSDDGFDAIVQGIWNAGVIYLEPCQKADAVHLKEEAQLSGKRFPTLHDYGLFRYSDYYGHHNINFTVDTLNCPYR